MSATSVRRSEGILVGTLSIVVLTVAILQTAVVPILTVIATQVGASAVNVSWVLTANLLAAAASTPLIGRLADLRSKKRVLLAVLGLVLAGSVLAAVTSSLALLVLARVLQGASFSLYPVSVAVLRDEVPAGHRVADDRDLEALGLEQLGHVAAGLALATAGAADASARYF